MKIDELLNKMRKTRTDPSDDVYDDLTRYSFTIDELIILKEGYPMIMSGAEAFLQKNPNLADDVRLWVMFEW